MRFHETFQNHGNPFLSFSMVAHFLVCFPLTLCQKLSSHIDNCSFGNVQHITDLLTGMVKSIMTSIPSFRTFLLIFLNLYFCQFTPNSRQKLPPDTSCDEKSKFTTFRYQLRVLRKPEIKNMYSRFQTYTRRHEDRILITRVCILFNTK